MTIHRHLAQGRLRWHGAVRHGPAAKGIDLDDYALILQQQPNRDAKSAGVEAKIKRFITDCGYDWRQVIARFMVAAVQKESDIDFMIFATSQLVKRNKSFLTALLNNKVLPKTGFKDYAEYAAFRVQKMGRNCDRIFDSLKKGTFSQAWRGHIKFIQKLDVNVYPCLVFWPYASLADIILHPRWLDNMPPVRWHDREAAVSLIALRRRKEIKNLISATALKLAHVQFGASGKQRLNLNAKAWKAPAFKIYQTAVADILGSSLLRPDSVKWLEKIGLEKRTAREFAKELRRLAGRWEKKRQWKSKTPLEGARKHISFNQSESYKYLKAVSASAMARRLGVSRLTMRRWLKRLNDDDKDNMKVLRETDSETIAGIFADNQRYDPSENEPG